VHVPQRQPGLVSPPAGRPSLHRTPGLHAAPSPAHARSSALPPTAIPRIPHNVHGSASGLPLSCAQHYFTQ
jgi:hypothetical protein